MIGPIGPIIGASITAAVLLLGTIATLTYNGYKDRKDRKHQQKNENERLRASPLGINVSPVLCTTPILTFILRYSFLGMLDKLFGHLRAVQL
jgi:hypothetical protein